MDKLNSLDFQRQFLALCLMNNDYAKIMIPVISPDYFNEKLGNIWKTIHNGLVEYKFSSFESIKVDLKSAGDPHIEELATIKNAMEKLAREPGQIRWIQDNVLEFVQGQEAKKALHQCLVYLKTGEYNKMLPLFQKVLQVGMGGDKGLEYEIIGDRLDSEKRDTLSTGIPVLDKAFKGGFAGGELISFMAPSGVGKSWMLSAVGAAAFKAGKTVVHFSCELLDRDTANRYDTILTGKSLEELKKNPKILEDVIKHGGLLRVKEYPMSTATVHTLRSYIEQLHLADIYPDLILVDYADLMIDSDGGKERHAIANIYKQLRGMAQEFKIPVCTASQTNRGAVDQFIIDETAIAEEYRKIAHSDIIISLSRAKYDEAYKGARLFIVKQRRGPDKILFPGIMDTSNGQLRFFDKDSAEGKDLYERMVDAKDNYERTGTLSLIEPEIRSASLATLLNNIQGR